MIGDFFELFLINPLTNLFVLLSVVLGNTGLALIALTVVIRVVTIPLQMRQMKMTRLMAAISPRVQEINKRYSDPRRRSEEQMKLYREMGVNPLGCLSGMVIQFPIFIALYGVIRLSLGESPEAIVDLSRHLYNWQLLKDEIPLGEHFLWMNLARPDPLVIPLLVALTTYVYQKMSTVPPTDARQAQQASMMNMMMPLIFGWIALTLPSGVGLYYLLSNLIGMVMQYLYVGGGAINWRSLVGLSQEPVLPRAVMVRQQTLDAVKNASPDEPDPDRGPGGGRRRRARDQSSDGRASGDSGAQDGAAAPENSAAKRRRRYASGRRRGRR